MSNKVLYSDHNIGQNSNMKTISVSSDIIPIGEFKSAISKYIKYINNKGKQVVITQNGKPAGVVISPTAFDELQEARMFIDSILRGMIDSDDGKLYTSEEIRKILKKLRSE